MRAVSTSRPLLVAALVFTSLIAGHTTAQARPGAAGAAPPQPTYQHVCRPPEAGRASCAAELRTDLPRIEHLDPRATPPGYGPADIRRAYNLFGARSDGRTVAIVVAFHNPNLESDLAVYRKQFHLPPCTKANGCLSQIYGSGTRPPVDSEWSLEESLDVDAVSAACPDCKITVVEAAADTYNDLFIAEDVATGIGSRYVSNSWFSPEFPEEHIFDDHFSPGVVYTFAGGDSGYGTVYPAASPYVTAVGGTSLRRAHNRRGWAESAWSGTGSGCSIFEPKPSFQHDPLCANRTENDVSADADPGTGLAVYDTVPTPSGATGWLVEGGTSLSTPLIAAMYALAGTPAPNSRPNSYPYAHRKAFNDIVTGANGSCGGTYLCTAVKGYDGPTGIGTPHGVRGLAADGMS
ncbi:S53 family peptidase [Kitasatospora sp. NPDC004669]|uniref:S53 family peptidase n=1 Tax=Kitasatospora sp. NPDC004669 TaxID=3154555 RepID=UPI00339FAA55